MSLSINEKVFFNKILLIFIIGFRIVFECRHVDYNSKTIFFNINTIF